MKKLLALLLALCLLAVPAMGEMGSVDEGNPPLAPAIFLKGNPATGYAWTAEVDDEKVVTVVSEYYPDETAAQQVGEGGEYYFRFDGVAEGAAIITLRYARANAADENVPTLVYHVTVDANLHVYIYQMEVNPGL